MAKRKSAILDFGEFEKILREKLLVTQVDISRYEERLRESHSGRTGDLADAAVGSFISDEDARLYEARLRYRDKIYAALEAIKKRTYGKCRSCGSPIPDVRLRAYPIALRCRICEEAREDKKVKPKGANDTGKGKTYGS